MADCISSINGYDLKDATARDHAADKSNPHEVTAAQAGALSSKGGTVSGSLTVTGAITSNNDVNINGGKVRFNKPVTTGGWARGVEFFSTKESTGVREGAFGFFGNGANPASLVMMGLSKAGNNSWWSESACDGGVFIGRSSVNVKPELQENGKRVYSPNNKPTPADIGAATTAQIDAIKGEISDIKTGANDTVVGKAAVAVMAGTAMQATSAGITQNYDTAGGTIKEKFDDIDEHLNTIPSVKNMLTTDTKQTVSGQKIFNDYALVMTDHVDFIANDIDIKSNPTNEKFAYFNGKDKNGNILGAIGFYQDPTGKTGAYLQANNGSNWGGNLGIKTKAGTSDVFAYAPNPPSASNTNEIATTYWAKSQKPMVNGDSEYNSSNTYYAPTSAGKSRQFLLSNGIYGEPIWYNPFDAIFRYSSLNASNYKYGQFIESSTNNTLLIMGGENTASGSSATDVTISFPRSFYFTPHVVATYGSTNNTQNYYSWIKSISNSGFTCRGYGGWKIYWIAFGTARV